MLAQKVLIINNFFSHFFEWTLINKTCWSNQDKFVTKDTTGKSLTFNTKRLFTSHYDVQKDPCLKRRVEEV